MMGQGNQRWHRVAAEVLAIIAALWGLLPTSPATACSPAFSYSDVTLVSSYPSTSGTIPADKGVLLVFRPTIKANHNLQVEWYPPKKFQAWKKDGDGWVQIPIVLDEGIEKPPAAWGIGPWSTEPVPVEVFHCEVSAWESGLENGRVYRIRAPGGWTAGVEHEIRFQMANTSAMEIEFAEEPAWYEDSFSFTPSEPSGSGVVSPQKLTVELLEEQGICDHDCWVSSDCEDCTGYARMAQRFHVSLPSLGVTLETGPRVLRLTATGTDTITGDGLPGRIHFSFLVMSDHPQTADFTLQRCGPIDGKGDADGCEVCFQALIEAIDGQLLWDSKEHCFSVYQVPKPEDPCASYAENLDYDEGDEPPTPLPWPTCGVQPPPEPLPDASFVETDPDAWSSEIGSNEYRAAAHDRAPDALLPPGDTEEEAAAPVNSGRSGSNGCTADGGGNASPLAVLVVLLLLWNSGLRRRNPSSCRSLSVLLRSAVCLLPTLAMLPSCDAGDSECEEVYGYDFDETGLCITSEEPKLVGCFGVEEGFNDFCEMEWTCYLSPDHETVVVASCHGGPPMMLETEGWTRDCPGLEESLGEPFLPLCGRGR